MIRSLEALRERAAAGPGRRVAVAGAGAPAAVEAAVEAARIGLADCILVGETAKVREALRSAGAPAGRFEIVDADGPDDAAARAVSLVRTGAAGLLLKGSVDTGTLLRAVLHRDRGLRSGRLLSDVFVFDFPRGDGERIAAITDGGINVAPTVREKIEIARNAVEAFHALGYDEPRVAVLSAVERVTPEIPSTVDAAEVAERAREGEIPGCVVDGPLALDLAVSPEAARMKGFESPVAGRADILLCPGIEAANMVAKAVNHLVPLEPAHVVVGARAPVLIPSRSESPGAKVNAMALGCVVADG